MGCLKLAYYQEPELSVVHSKKELSLKISSKSVRSEHHYLFGGKELQDDDLGGVSLGLYDFTNRFYDPSGPFFTTMDPLAEKFPWQSPYCYAANNPIRFIDKDGNSPEIPPYARAAVSQLQNTCPAVSTRVSQPNLIRVTPQSSQQPMATISQAPSNYTKFVDTHYSPEIRQQLSTDVSLPLAATAVATVIAAPAIVSELGIVNEALQTGAVILQNTTGLGFTAGFAFGATSELTNLSPDIQNPIGTVPSELGSNLGTVFTNLFMNYLNNTGTTSTTTSNASTNTTTTTNTSTTTTNTQTNSSTSTTNNQDDKNKPK